MNDFDPEDVSDIKTDSKFITPEVVKTVMKYRKAFKEGRLTLDNHGHSTIHEERITVLLDPWSFIHGHFGRFPIERIDRMLEEPLHGEFDDLEWLCLGDGMECRNCGVKVKYYTNGLIIKAIEQEYKREARNGRGEIYYHDRDCVYILGLPTPTVEIEVPSGYLVLGNDFRDDYFTEEMVWGGEDADSRYVKQSICSFAGRLKYMAHYATFGLATATMHGGSDVYYSPESIILGNGALVDPENDEDTTEETIVLDGITHQRVAHISFGLWWYGAADLDRLKQINPEKASKIKVPRKNKNDPPLYHSNELFKLKVNPGRWQLTHHMPDEGQPVVSRIRLISQ